MDGEGGTWALRDFARILQGYHAATSSQLKPSILGGRLAPFSKDQKMETKHMELCVCVESRDFWVVPVREKGVGVKDTHILNTNGAGKISTPD